MLNKKTKTKKSDVLSYADSNGWAYSKIVKSHFFKPRNFLAKDPRPAGRGSPGAAKSGEFDAEGQVGSPQCGDVMRMWMKIDFKTEKIKKLKWRTFGCASAIAATSMFSTMVTEKGGMKIGNALKIKPQDIMKRLGGLPGRKIHCSVLCDKAFYQVANDYFRKTNQHKRIIVEGSKIIDKRLNITERDIEGAVLDGARSLVDVQKKLKVGVGDPKALPQIEQLIRFYKEKYYG